MATRKTKKRASATKAKKDSNVTELKSKAKTTTKKKASTTTASKRKTTATKTKPEVKKTAAAKPRGTVNVKKAEPVKKKSGVSKLLLIGIIIGILAAIVLL